MLPNVFYYLFWYGGRGRNSNPLLAAGSLVVYFVLQLLVLYASRIREYAADEGAVKLGNPPHWMASALYKLVYGAARVPKESMADAAGYKAFFASDPSHAAKEIGSLAELDLDRSGTIEPEELDALRRSKTKPTGGATAVEVLSTHPDMLKRIRRLAELQEQGAFRVGTPHV
jgi:heat shock protein HtpX